MTIQSNDRRKEYAGNDVTTVFTGPRAFADSHIAVYLVDDATDVATLTTAYTLTGDGVRNRATTVTMDAAPATGKTLLILRTVPFEQGTQITNQGAYSPGVVEDMADALSQQTQQLADRDARTIRLADTAILPDGFTAELPGPAALKPLVWNAAGTALENGDTTLTGDMLLRGNLASPDAGKGAALVRMPGSEQTVSGVLLERVRITHYKTAANTYTDALLLAYNAVAVGGVIEFPQGQGFNVAVSLAVSKSVTFKGEGRDLPAIICDGTFSPFVIAEGTNGVIFDGLQILAAGAPKIAGTAGIKAVATSLVNGIGYLEVRNCNINGFDRGVWAEYCQLGQISGCRLWANRYNYYSKRCVNMTLDLTIMESAALWGCYIDGDPGEVSGSAGTLLSMCDIVGNGAAGGGIDGGNFRIQYNEHFSLENCMIDVPSAGSKFNIRAIGVSRGNIGGGSWVGASKGSGIYFTGCDSITIGACNILSSASYGIELETTSNCVISGPVLESNGAEDIIIYGTASVGTDNIIAAARLKSTASATSISEVNVHATTVGNSVRCAGAVTLATGSFHAKRVHAAVAAVTLIGGAATESIDVPFPSGLFAAKPDCVVFVGVDYPISAAYKSAAVATNATNARMTLVSIDGALLPAGVFNYSVLAYGR